MHIVIIVIIIYVGAIERYRLRGFNKTIVVAIILLLYFVSACTVK